jgi:sortase A
VLGVLLALLVGGGLIWALTSPQPTAAPTEATATVLPTASPPATLAPPTATLVPPSATLPPTETMVPTFTPPPTATLVPPTATPRPAVVVRVPPPATPAPRATPTPRKAVSSGAPKVSTPTPPHKVTVYADVPRFGDPRPKDPHRIVHISSPDVRLDTDVIEVYPQKNGVWGVADYAAGHHWGTAAPGQGGNIVVTGHNNWRGEVFRYLEFMQPGNTIVVTTADGGTWRYVVQQMQKLPEKNVSWNTAMEHAEVMSPTSYERLTLITCWPYTTFTHRLVIFAAPIR